MHEFHSREMHLSKPTPHANLAAGLSLLGWALACAVAVLAFAQPAAAQQTEPGTGLEIDPRGGRDVVVVLEGDARKRIALAFPRSTSEGALTSAGSAAARELEDTLRNDLEASRVFDIQGPDALSVLNLSGDPLRDLEQYRSLGNEILLLAKVQQQGDKLIFEGRLLALNNGESVLGKRYEGTFDVSRTIAHTFADEVILYLAGRRGIARTSIAFSSDRSGHKEIYLMDYDGENQRRITAHQSISMAPAWNGAGSSLVYLSYLGGVPGIYRVDLATGKKRAVINDGEHNLTPSYSPDGSTVAFSRSLAGNTEIFTSRLDGGGLRRLTTSGAIDTNPVWSPNGQHIAFTSSRNGNPNIFIMDSDGANVRRITFDGDYNDGAAWNPEGNRIVYASRRKGVFQLALTDVVTLETEVLTSGNRNKEEPTFSPDGQRIAFTAHGPRGTQIYLIDLEGNVLGQLTSDGNNAGPSWSPYPQRKGG